MVLIFHLPFTIHEMSRSAKRRMRQPKPGNFNRYAIIVTTIRIDKWLWAARFFKTRSLAQAAVRGGHVEINGHACKPARTVAVGDRLNIVRGESRFEIEIVDVSDRRGPAAHAQALYRELPASVERREKLAEERRLLRKRGPGRRPDKRDRARIRSFSGKDV